MHAIMKMEYEAPFILTLALGPALKRHMKSLIWTNQSSNMKSIVV